VILAGDAAHSFPPSGGFGMNTGIADIQNLAHRLERILSTDNYKVSNGETSQYSLERQLAGSRVLEVSMKYYWTSINVAKKLGLNIDN
jgi:2-polyprenyl-6-methoxyphenol hydroxylase-like FAD-dependent oxidoreductase